MVAGSRVVASLNLLISSDNYFQHLLVYQKLETLAHCSIKKAVIENHQLLCTEH